MKRNQSWPIFELCILIILGLFSFGIDLAVSNDPSTVDTDGDGVVDASDPHTDAIASIYYILNPRLDGGNIFVTSLVDGNSITAGSTALNLDQYESGTIPEGSFSQGDTIAAIGPIAVSGGRDATDLPVPRSFAGTDFVILHMTGNHHYYMMSPFGDAVAEVDLGAGPVAIALPKGQVVTHSVGGDNTISGVVTSDIPIVVAHLAKESGDWKHAYPVPPTTTEVVGIYSKSSIVGATEDGTSVSVYASDGSSTTYTLDRGGRVPVSIGSGASEGRGEAVRIVADKPIAAVQYGDGDGAETTAYLSPDYFGTEYIFPLNVQYAAVAGLAANTTVTLYDGANPPEVVNLVSDGITPAKGYFGSASDGNRIGAGARLVSDQPIYVIFELASNNDEHNLLGLGPFTPNLAILDSDQDGIIDRVEDANGNGVVDVGETDPQNPDSDGDLLSDGQELIYWGADWNADTDGDGIINILDADSDSDGALDGVEIAQGTDPADDSSYPLTTANTPDVDHGLWADEFQGGGGFIANGVRLINGNVVDARSDLKLSSPHGQGFFMQAFYNSQSNSPGSTGTGWRHSFEISFQGGLTIEGDPVFRITDETGQAHYFRDAGAGQFVPLFHDRTALVMEGANYVWKRLDGSRVGFSSSGRLAWIDDVVGSRLTCSYDGQGRLSTVTDAATSRSISYTYNSDDRVESVQGPATTAVPTGVYATYGYDASGNLTSVLYADGSGFDYTYNDPSDPTNLTEKHNKAGHHLASWVYDAQDRCVDVYTPFGTGASIDYDSATQVTVTDDYSTARVYTLTAIDGRPRITAMQGPAAAPYANSSIVRWAYDANLNLAEVEDARGTIYQYVNFDTRGNPGEVILAAGTSEERRIQLAWHPTMRALLSRSELSLLGGGATTTVWDYDTDGNTQANEAPGPLTTRIIATGYTHNAAQSAVAFEYITGVTYNPQGQVTAIDGPKPGTADTTTFVYESVTKDLQQVVKPIVGATRYENYDALGRVGQVVGVNGLTTAFTYDARGRVTAITHAADGASRTIVYNSAGQPDTVTDEDGVITTYEYDAANGYLTHVYDHEGNYIAHTYDTRGNRIETGKYSGAGVRTSRKRWDYNHPTLPGLLWKTIKHNEAYSAYDYDANGNPVSVRDFNGHTTSTTFDRFNRPLTVTEPGTNGVTAYTYDAHGNLALVVDAEDRQTTYVFDDLGRTLSVDSADSGLTALTYDEAGNLVGKTDARGITASYAYDDLNRLTQVTFPDPVENITYAYDSGDNAMGRLTSITDPAGTTAFGYDARGRLERKTASIMGQDYSLLRLFTAAGRSLGYSYPSGRMVNYTRDANGRVDGATTQHNGNMIELFSNMAYNPFGAPSGLNNGAGGNVSSISTDCGCLEVANPGAHMEQQYAYDDNGNVTSVTWTNLPGYNQTYAYDELNRLTNATNPLGSFGFTYDKVGNRLTRTKDTEVETYTYQTDANRLATVTGAASVNYGYDNGGNITAIGDRTLVYNQAGRLQRVEEDAAVLGEYTYNALGQRVTKTVGGVVTVFHYDFDGNIIAESGTDGTFTREYIYTTGNRFAMVDVSAEKVYYYLNDHLGTPVFMTDENNVVVWEATYPPFGNADISTSTEIENNFRYAGQYYDAETGLHYNYHRYYDPQTGRYLTPDPIGLSGGINLYAYALNNPINLIDPFGLQSGAPSAPGMPLFPPILPPVFYPGTPENDMIVEDITRGSRGLHNGILGLGDFLYGGGLGNWIYDITHPIPEEEINSCPALEAKKSGKEKASDIPSWAKGERPLPGESGKDFAKRVLDKKYGPGNYPKGPGSEYNKVKKYGDRSKKK